MKKFAAVIGMVLTLGLAAGCGSANQEADTTSSAGKSVTGVIEEVTDTYFSIETEDGTIYQFPFTDENNIDLSNAFIGDEIKLTYEGELSDVDMFDGILTGSEILK